MQRLCATAARTRHSLRRAPPLALHTRFRSTSTSQAAVASSSSSGGDATQQPLAFDSLVAAPATSETVALRLQQYFDAKELNAASPALRNQIVHSPAFVHKLGPLLQWAFQHLPTPVPGASDSSSNSNSSQSAAPEQELAPLPQSQTPHKQQQQQQPASESESAASAPPLARDAVATLFVLLTPWTNIARDRVWRSYYMRQFFLSRAPLAAFLHVLELHASVLPAHRASTARDTAFIASELVIEFCSRGRFAEAIAAYAALPLSDRTRRDVVQIVQDHEQYASLVALYEAHKTLTPPAAPLDPLPLLHALNVLKRHDELNRAFQQLSPKDQSRADIQQLVG